MIGNWQSSSVGIHHAENTRYYLLLPRQLPVEKTGFPREQLEFSAEAADTLSIYRIEFPFHAVSPKFRGTHALVFQATSNLFPGLTSADPTWNVVSPRKAMRVRSMRGPNSQ